jgi:hypothetical protein
LVVRGDGGWHGTGKDCCGETVPAAAGQSGEARRKGRKSRKGLNKLVKRFEVEAVVITEKVKVDRRPAKGKNEDLLKHMDTVFTSTTESATDNRMYAWCHYCFWRYGDAVPSLEQTLEDWPPSCFEWQAFLVACGSRCTTNDGAKINWGN